jgi:hypothetical protein
MAVHPEPDYSQCQSGDILLFRGTGWLSRVIEWMGRSRYSHVGILLRDPTYIHPDLTGLYVLHSTIGPPGDMNGEIRDGVQITRLADLMASYGPGGTYIRHLRVRRDPLFVRTLGEIYRDHANDPYDLRLTDWIEAKCLVDGDGTNCLRYLGWKNPRKPTTFWCSALAAFVYYRLGLLEDPKDVPWSLIAPTAWATDGESFLRFRHCELGPEMPLGV